ncbi:MAG: 4-(cytidine 5'-diphospho)-2-C-methyl-D-erythritol kinase, partial [Alphaproteobacteria bacterium]
EARALSKLALHLGADVPVCLRRRPAIMRGIGEQLSAAPTLPDCYVLLVNPRILLSTRAVFEKLDGRFDKAPQRFPRHVSSTKKLARLLRARGNNLERPAIELVPEIQTVLNALAGQKGCLLARMSGSGATCFGLFANADEMGAAAIAIKREHPEYWQAQTRFR